MSQDDKFVFFWNLKEENEEFVNWYPAEFTVEGIVYKHVEQYMMAKKALLFQDYETYKSIMSTKDPRTCKALGRCVKNFSGDIWNKCKYEIVYNAVHAKFVQNEELRAFLLSTGDKIIAEASPSDCVWGIGLKSNDPKVINPNNWRGENLLGKALMEVRSIIKEGAE